MYVRETAEAKRNSSDHGTGLCRGLTALFSCSLAICRARTRSRRMNALCVSAPFAALSSFRSRFTACRAYFNGCSSKPFLASLYRGRAVFCFVRVHQTAEIQYILGAGALGEGIFRPPAGGQ